MLKVTQPVEHSFLVSNLWNWSFCGVLNQRRRSSNHIVDFTKFFFTHFLCLVETFNSRYNSKREEKGRYRKINRTELLKTNNTSVSQRLSLYCYRSVNILGNNKSFVCVVCSIKYIRESLILLFYLVSDNRGKMFISLTSCLSNSLGGFRCITSILSGL